MNLERLNLAVASIWIKGGSLYINTFPQLRDRYSISGHRILPTLTKTFTRRLDKFIILFILFRD